MSAEPKRIRISESLAIAMVYPLTAEVSSLDKGGLDLLDHTDRREQHSITYVYPYTLFHAPFLSTLNSLGLLTGP